MTNITIYINTTIRTINFTICMNTILTILKLNRTTYRNTIAITLNNTINVYCTTTTIYSSSLLIKTWIFSLYSSRILINTICRTCITNIRTYINTTTRTSNFTIYRNTIITVFKLNTRIYFNTNTINTKITFNSTINEYCTTTTIYSSTILIKTWATLDSSRILINTIIRIHITIFISYMSNICIYVNSTISTCNFTIYSNTILTIFKWNRTIY